MNSLSPEIVRERLKGNSVFIPGGVKNIIIFRHFINFRNYVQGI